MAPGDILLYAYIIVFFDHHQISFFPAVDGNEYRGPQPMCSERLRNVGKLNTIQVVSIKSLPSVLRNFRQQGSRKSIKARGDGGQQENKPF